jgi:hypothetical protein
MDDLEIGVQFPVGVRDFSLLHSVQTEFLAHPALYAMGKGDCFSGRGMKLTIHLHPVPMMELYFHSPVLHDVVHNS